MSDINHTPAPETPRNRGGGVWGRPRRPSPPHPVTAGLFDREIIRMDAEGKSVLQMAIELGCSDGTVRNRLAMIYPADGAPRG